MEVIHRRPTTGPSRSPGSRERHVRPSPDHGTLVRHGPGVGAAGAVARPAAERRQRSAATPVAKPVGALRASPLHHGCRARTGAVTRRPDGSFRSRRSPPPAPTPPYRPAPTPTPGTDPASPGRPTNSSRTLSSGPDARRSPGTCPPPAPEVARRVRSPAAGSRPPAAPSPARDRAPARRESSRRSRAHAARASPCRPHRYRARAYSSQTRSRNGLSRASGRTVSGVLAAAPNRVPPARCRSPQICGPPPSGCRPRTGKTDVFRSASTSPRHNASASPSISTASRHRSSRTARRPPPQRGESPRIHLVVGSRTA